MLLVITLLVVPNLQAQKTKGKKTTFAAVCYVAFQLVLMKYPDLVKGSTENLIEMAFASGFFVTLGHKLRIYIPAARKWLKKAYLKLKNKNNG